MAAQAGNPCFGPPEGALVVEPVAWNVHNRVELTPGDWQGVTLRMQFANQRVMHWSVGNLLEQVSAEAGGCWGEIEAMFPPNVPSAYEALYTYSGEVNGGTVAYVNVAVGCGIKSGYFHDDSVGTWFGYGANLLCLSEISADRVSGAAVVAAPGRYFEDDAPGMTPFYVSFDFHRNENAWVDLIGAQSFTWWYDGLTEQQAWDPVWWETRYGHRTEGDP